MAVYERTYRPYAGELTPERTRFLVLPRYAYEEVFRSKLFIAFLAACMIWPLVLAVLIYLPHNLSFLELFDVSQEEILDIFTYGESFFLGWFMVPHTVMAGLVALIVGPAMIAADLRNNGLPLYLSRPFNRWEYILGKTAVLVILLSAVTWVPGILLFLLKAYLGGGDWLADHYRIGPAILLCSGLWIVMLCLLSLAISAYVKWKPVARITLLVIWFPLAIMANIINFALGTSWGSVLDLLAMVKIAYVDLFGLPAGEGIPSWAAWLTLLIASGFCLLLLSRRLRAYEVVRS